MKKDFILNNKRCIKLFSVMIAMFVSFFASSLLTAKVKADTNTIASIYQGNYYNESVSNYWLFINGETSIVFRGKYNNVVIAGTSPSYIYFNPGATGTVDNFQTTFSSWSRLVDDYFVSQPGSVSIAAHYYNLTGKFRMQAASSTYHYYSK